MRTISIQVQPDKVPNLELEKINQLFKEIKKNTLIERAYFDEGNDQGRYINFNYDSNDVQSLWVEIQDVLYKSESISKDLCQCSMVMCSGENGWDDYILLHHFDPTVVLDDFR